MIVVFAVMGAGVHHVYSVEMLKKLTIVIAVQCVLLIIVYKTFICAGCHNFLNGKNFEKNMI